ncbi:Metallo-dependent phosphatase [Aaosphaeria arxii CBS 175.79]|uniref:Metallo-dependent phosphatase n=1 Tax=Aaosphaeria arxii CBS 175.79 TaxID=1450172 RepID=A0A6A5X6Q9_9PLEO|nr:Metallo-dependent phosphatase [Aaosphaeria arxii CBS 175.79]KAF2008581.1 Metallo-dependent phosphatase [Aaosphaeria arxii CBS 175.79]
MYHNNFDGRPESLRLIDLIPDNNVYASDEEDSFYRHDDDDDYIIHPKWRALAQQTSQKIPRRVQRFSAICLVLLLVAWITWKIHYGPQYAERKQLIMEMDTVPEAAYGTSLRPVFKDMIHMKTLDEKHLPKGDKRLVIVGDVHGCKEELEQLLQEVGFDEKNDHLILTGDIIAKGPDSKGVVSLAEKLGASCVRGNHEDKVLLSLQESSHRHAGLQGPDEDPDRETDFLEEQSFSHGDYKLRKFAKSFSKKQIGWLKECPVILRVGHIPDIGDLVVVHAGLVPDMPLEQQDPFQCMNMRTIDLKTRIPSESRDHTHWEKFWNHQQKKLPKKERLTVAYGHDAKRGLNINKYTFGLDSNCVRGGKLTAMVIDAAGKQKIVQIKCKTNYTEKELPPEDS